MNNPSVDALRSYCLFERVQGQLGAHRRCHPQSDDHAGENVDNKSEKHETDASRNVRKIGYPQLIRPRRVKVAMDKVGRIAIILRGNRRSLDLPPHGSL